uniref:RRM domain-containing protein n=1 Tax=Schistocephalus solidus TaxID=70667 RepID=A0A0X3NRT2_SCHSO
MIQRKSSVMAVKTPESQKQKTPQSNKKTPNSKLGGKRPLPDDSEEDEPILDQTPLKMKKMKHQEESDDSDPAVGSEEDSEEDVSNDEDEDDDNEGDEDEDDDSEDDEVDDSEEDEDDKEDKIGSNLSGESNKASQKQKNKTSVKGEDKQAPKQKAVQQPVAKSSTSAATSKVAPSHVLLFNFDSLNENLLSGFLKKRGVNPQSIGCIYSPVALIGLSNDEAAKKAVSACSGATYNARSLSAVMVSGDTSKILTSKPKQPISSDTPLLTVFATNLPKSLTADNIKKMVGIEPKAMRLMTTGPKNKLFNACYIDCTSEADAKKAFEALEGRSESGTNIRAFLKGAQQWAPLTESSLIITNAPFAVGVDQMKKEFPTASSVESMRKGAFHLSFKSKEDREKAADQARGKVMDGRQLRVVTPGEDMKAKDDAKKFSIVVSNLPFTSKIDEIRALYPGCTWVTIKKRDDGKFSGVAVVSFKSEDAAKKALDETPSKQLQGRQLRAHLEGQQAEGSKKDTPAKKEAKQTVSKEQKKTPVLPAQVGSESEDDDDDEDEKEETDSEDDDAEQEEDEAGSEDDETGSEDADDSGAGDEPASEETDEDSAEAPPAKQPKRDGAHQNGPAKPFRGFGGNKFQGGRGSPRGGRGGNGFRGGNSFRGSGGRGFKGQSQRGRGGGFRSNWRGGK